MDDITRARSAYAAGLVHSALAQRGFNVDEIAAADGRFDIDLSQLFGSNHVATVTVKVHDRAWPASY